MAAEEGGPHSWRALWVSAGALLATLALIGLIFLITQSNRARDEAMRWERSTNALLLLTRNIDASISRAETQLSRLVLESERERAATRGTATSYYNEWRTAGSQIEELQRLMRGDPLQARRAAEVATLFRQRSAELGPAAYFIQQRGGDRKSVV